MIHFVSMFSNFVRTLFSVDWPYVSVYYYIAYYKPRNFNFILLFFSLYLLRRVRFISLFFVVLFLFLDLWYHLYNIKSISCFELFFFAYHDFVRITTSYSCPLNCFGFFFSIFCLMCHFEIERKLIHKHNTPFL